MRQLMRASAILPALLCVTPTSAGAEGIVNGGFENGAIGPWVAEGPLNVGIQALFAPPEGSLGAMFSPGAIDQVGRFSQSFNLANGGSFDVNFFAGRGESTSGSNDVPLTFRVLLDGQLLTSNIPSRVTSVPFFTQFDSYSFSRTLSAGTHTLAFEVSRGQTLFGRGPFFIIDGVDVVRATAPGVPEPASWAMMIAGFGLAGAAARRRRCTANAMSSTMVRS